MASRVKRGTVLRNLRWGRDGQKKALRSQGCLTRRTLQERSYWPAHSLLTRASSKFRCVQWLSPLPEMSTCNASSKLAEGKVCSLLNVCSVQHAQIYGTCGTR